MHIPITIRGHASMALLLWILMPVVAWAQPPVLVDRIDFSDAAVGETIEPLRYRDRGVILTTNPGHHLYIVDRGGNKCLAVSPGSSEPLSIEVQFVMPGTHNDGRVQMTDIRALDADGMGYSYEFFDQLGVSANSGSNHNDYNIGGWYYTEGPVAHRFVFTINEASSQFLDDIQFSEIAPAAGITHCSNCVLGLYDDMDLTESIGQATGDTKVIYIGVNLPEEDRLQCLEFSVAGLEPFVVTQEFFGSVFAVDGQVAGPSQPGENGGVQILYSGCSASGLVGKITLTRVGDWPINKHLRIEQRYGGTYVGAPHFKSCAETGIRTLIPMTQNYILNSTTSVEARSWSVVKQLYQ